MKTGKEIIHIDFANVFYAEGVQGFSLSMKVLKRVESYLVGDIIYNDMEGSGRCAVLNHIEFELVKKYCPELW